MKVLMTAYDFSPNLGGVATLGDGVARGLSLQPDMEVRVLARLYPSKIESPLARREGEGRESFVVERFKWSPKTFYATFQLWPIIQRNVLTFRPDCLVNMLWLPGGACTGLLPGLHSRTPYYMFAHGVEVLESCSTFPKLMRRFLSPVKKTIFKRATGIFTISEYTAELVHHYCGVPASRITVVPPGIDVARLSPGPAPDKLLDRYGRGRKIAIFLSRLEDYKGGDAAIRALRRVKRDHPEAALLFVGDGADRQRLQTLCSRYGLGHDVWFSGSVSQAELIDHIRLGEVALLLSREDYEKPAVEGFGLAILEAALCGIPTIGGRSGGIPEAVLDGVTGLLADPEDPRDIAAKWSSVLESPEQRARLGSDARLRVLEQARIDQLGEAVYGVIKRAGAA